MASTSIDPNSGLQPTNDKMFVRLTGVLGSGIPVKHLTPALLNPTRLKHSSNKLIVYLEKQ